MPPLQLSDQASYSFRKRETSVRFLLLVTNSNIQVMLIYLICFLLRKWLGLKCCFVLQIIKHSPVKTIMGFLKLSCIIFVLFFFSLMGSLLLIYIFLFKPAGGYQYLLLPFSVTIRMKDSLFQLPPTSLILISTRTNLLLNSSYS